MQISSAFKTIFAAGIALLIISCGDSKKKVKVQEVTLQDIKQEEKDVEPPPPPPPKEDPPKVEVKNAMNKCFANDGLKYKTVINLSIGETDCIGIVTSEDLESGKKESTGFTGTISGDKLTIKFKGTAPVIGSASEWTDKPWSLKKDGGKETLHIVFSAKNYDTNKWKDTDYLFAPADCK
jgi:hypothetical protein